MPSTFGKEGSVISESNLKRIHEEVNGNLKFAADVRENRHNKHLKPIEVNIGDLVIIKEKKKGGNLFILLFSHFRVTFIQLAPIALK